MKTIAYVFVSEHRRNMVRHNVEHSMNLQKNTYNSVLSDDHELEIFFLLIDEMIAGLRFDLLIFDDAMVDKGLLKANFMRRLKPRRV